MSVGLTELEGARAPALPVRKRNLIGREAA
jgi:hypothetical protein